MEARSPTLTTILTLFIPLALNRENPRIVYKVATPSMNRGQNACQKPHTLRHEAFDFMHYGECSPFRGGPLRQCLPRFFASRTSPIHAGIFNNQPQSPGLDGASQSAYVFSANVASCETEANQRTHRFRQAHTVPKGGAGSLTR